MLGDSRIMRRKAVARAETLALRAPSFSIRTLLWRCSGVLPSFTPRAPKVCVAWAPSQRTCEAFSSGPLPLRTVDAVCCLPPLTEKRHHLVSRQTYICRAIVTSASHKSISATKFQIHPSLQIAIKIRPSSQLKIKIRPSQQVPIKFAQDGK